MELTFDTRKNGRRRFVEVFVRRLCQRPHNLLQINMTTERERKGESEKGREKERARQIVAMVVETVQYEKK